MSKLLGFGYLRFRHLVVLVLILSLISTLFLTTAFSFLGFYRSFNSYLGEDVDIVAVYSPQSRTPFTASIPAYLSDPLSEVEGVLTVSPETIIPCVLDNQSVFVRGVLPTTFFKLNPTELVDGAIINETDFDCAMIGKNVADRFNLNVGDEVLVFSSVADRFLFLKICGVLLFESGMDDEVFVLLTVGQLLRFVDYNHVTLIRAKINPEIVNAAQIYETLSKSVQNQTVSSTISNSTSQYTNYQSLISWLPINFNINQLSVTSTQTIMKSYLDRYGVTREALSILSVLVFLLSSLTVVAATQTLLRQHKVEVETLQFVGASKRALKLDILFKLLPASFLACGLGALLAFVLLSWLNSNGFLRVLAHGLSLSFDPLVLMLNFFLVFSLVSFAILRGRFE